MDDLRGVVKVALRPGLITKHPQGQIGHIQATERVDRVRQQIRMLLGAIQIDYSGINVAGAARARIRGNSGETIGVASDEEEMIAAIRPKMNAGFSDTRGGTEDKDAPGFASRTLDIMMA